MYFESKKFAEAAKAYERCRALEPHDRAWLPQLAKIYSQSGDNEKLLGVLKDLAKLDADDLVTAQEAGQDSADAGKHADAERYARQSPGDRRAGCRLPTHPAGRPRRPKQGRRAGRDEEAARAIAALFV